MSHDLYTYGTLDPIFFKLTLDGAGVIPTLALGDITLTKSIGGVESTASIPVGVGGQIEAVGTTGLHKWTPGNTADTSADVLIINIKDLSGPPNGFDENCLIIATGGNAAARFSG